MDVGSCVPMGTADEIRKEAVLKMCPALDQAIPLSGIYPRKIITIVQRYVYKDNLSLSCFIMKERKTGYYLVSGAK